MNISRELMQDVTIDKLIDFIKKKYPEARNFSARQDLNAIRFDLITDEYQIEFTDVSVHAAYINYNGYMHYGGKRSRGMEVTIGGAINDGQFAPANQKDVVFTVKARVGESNGKTIMKKVLAAHSYLFKTPEVSVSRVESEFIDRPFEKTEVKKPENNVAGYKMSDGYVNKRVDIARRFVIVPARKDWEIKANWLLNVFAEGSQNTNFLIRNLDSISAKELSRGNADARGFYYTIFGNVSKFQDAEKQN